MRRGLDPSYYTDPVVFEAELDKVFAHTWLMVGHQSQVAKPGQLLTGMVGDQNILIANDHGTARAFYNVCQHRGHELVSDNTPRDVITCPYHAWTYSLDGNLLNARGEDVGPLCLPQVQLDTMAGYLYVNLDAEAETLAATIPRVEEDLLALAPDAPERQLTHQQSHLFQANWKLAVENYNECYHCPNVHKAFTTGVVSPGSYRIASRGHTIHHTAEGAAADRSGYVRPSESSEYGSFFTWPATSIQCYPGQVLNTFRWVPVAVDQTLLIREWWFDTTEPTDEQMEAITLDWDTTVSEDFSIMESVQRGMSSRGYTPGPLIENPSGVADTHSENTVAHLHDLLLAALGS